MAKSIITTWFMALFPSCCAVILASTPTLYRAGIPDRSPLRKRSVKSKGEVCEWPCAAQSGICTDCCQEKSGGIRFWDVTRTFLFPRRVMKRNARSGGLNY